MAIELISVGLVCADVTARPVEELPEKGKLSLVPSLELHIGGLAGVTACAYAALGGETAFLGSVGQDGFGDYLVQDLEHRGVDASGVVRTADDGTSATVVLVDGAGERTFVHHVGAAAHFSDAHVDLGQFPQARALHWGGPAVTPGLDGEPAGRMMEAAKAKGLLTSLDTCYDGEDVWYPRIAHALPHTDIVMSSFEEACKYTGQDTPEDIAAFYLSKGPGIALIKLGGEGVYVKTADAEVRVPAHAVPVVDSTGAGDVACGAFLFAYLREMDIEACARFANAAGALTVQVMGAAQGVKSYDQVCACMEQGA